MVEKSSGGENIVTRETVRFDKEGQIRVFVSRVATLITFILEAIDNSLEYTNLKNVSVNIVLKTINKYRSFIMISDDSGGILDAFWEPYRKKVASHLDPRGILGIFGEGIRRAGIAVSDNLEMFTITKLKSGITKWCLHKVLWRERITFLCYHGEGIPTKSNTELVEWKLLKNYMIYLDLKYLDEVESGTVVSLFFESYKHLRPIKETLSEYYQLALLNEKLSLSILGVSADDAEKLELIHPPEYVSDLVEYGNYSIGDDMVSATHYVGITIPKNLRGRSKYFVNGRMIADVRDRREDVFSCVDVSSAPGIVNELSTYEKTLSPKGKYLIVRPIEQQIRKRYIDREEVISDRELEEQVNDIVDSLLIEPHQRGKTPTKKIKKHNILTIHVRGEGTVIPRAGKHQQEKGDLIKIDATPANGWSFYMYEYSETMVKPIKTTPITHMEFKFMGNTTILVLFNQPPNPPPIKEYLYKWECLDCPKIDGERRSWFDTSKLNSMCKINKGHRVQYVPDTKEIKPPRGIYPIKIMDDQDPLNYLDVKKPFIYVYKNHKLQKVFNLLPKEQTTQAMTPMLGRIVDYLKDPAKSESVELGDDITYDINTVEVRAILTRLRIRKPNLFLNIDNNSNGSNKE